MKNLKAILSFAICASIIQIIHGISIENGINLIIPDANNGDAVRKCDSVNDLQRNKIAMIDSMAETEAIPDWIDNDLLDNVEDTVISTPYQSREKIIDFLEVLFDYKHNIDELQTNLSLKVVKIVQSIKDNTVLSDLLSKISNISSDEETASKETFEHCSLIDVAHESITLFNGNINQCINTFRFEIAPDIGKIVNQTIEISSNPNDANETEETISNLNKLTELIKSQNQISIINRNEPMDQFSICLENSKNQCISNLNTILTKMNSN